MRRLFAHPRRSTVTFMFLHIVVSINGSELYRYSFTENEILIGRSSECDVFLDNPGVSRTHAKLLHEGEQVKLIDLNSGNGTFLNGQAISEAFVDSGDNIGIGKFSVTAKLAAEPLPESETPEMTEPEPVASKTVFLRPEETRKILETQVPPKPATSAPVRPSPKTELKSSANWLFIAGAVVGLLCGWLIWG